MNSARKPHPAETALAAQKKTLRAEVRAARRDFPDKDCASEGIWRRLRALDEFACAKTVMAYVHAGDEVRTQPYFDALWREGRRIVVPRCQGDELALFVLGSFDELAPGALGILEPKPELLALPEHRIEPAAIDLVIVPGVAFDVRGGRIGQGRGYYDRFLARLPDRVSKIGVAYDCQLMAETPMGRHDVWLDLVVTESAVHRRRQSL